MNTLPCPQCGSDIEFVIVDGEVVTCDECKLDCEIHIGTAFDQTTHQELPVVLLEPLAEFQII
ncbi:hypothetical protein EON83_12355 [bacterium]|nr:MAG: hypothetical protein EON83_12355 [bacterium]